jgi:hypothetical protein
MASDDRTEELRDLARHARQKRDLYRARSYGQRPTSETRMRELERAADQAEGRLRAYVAERASTGGGAGR